MSAQQVAVAYSWVFGKIVFDSLQQRFAVYAIVKASFVVVLDCPQKSLADAESNAGSMCCSHV